MTINCSSSLSNELVSYLMGEASEEEIFRMEMHLLSCSSCRKDLQEIQEAWNMLPYDLEDVEVPADLKDEVMNAIFSTEEATEPEIEKSSPKRVNKKLHL